MKNYTIVLNDVDVFALNCAVQRAKFSKSECDLKELAESAMRKINAVRSKEDYILTLSWTDGRYSSIRCESIEQAVRTFVAERDRFSYGASQMEDDCGKIRKAGKLVNIVNFNGTLLND